MVYATATRMPGMEASRNQSPHEVKEQGLARMDDTSTTASALRRRRGSLVVERAHMAEGVVFAKQGNKAIFEQECPQHVMRYLKLLQMSKDFV